jgi:hypothetical protein
MKVSFDIHLGRLDYADWILGMLSAFMGFIEPGDEVIIFEPFFDQSVSEIQRV